jgi:hypothetical protein
MITHLDDKWLRYNYHLKYKGEWYSLEGNYERTQVIKQFSVLLDFAPCIYSIPSYQVTFKIIKIELNIFN